MRHTGSLVLTFLLLAFHAFAQEAAIHLSPTRQVRKGVEAWPLITDPKNGAEKRINSHLKDLNLRLLQSLKDCDSTYSQTFSGRSQPRAEEEGAEFWSQSVKLTMSGPGFLSLVATTDAYCGGAHPYGFTSAAVFDLKTGEPVDLREWFPPSLQASTSEEDDRDPVLEKSISVLGLLTAYKEATKHECDDTYSDAQTFLIWPDAASGEVMIQADRLPGCCEACGIEAGLTIDEARKLGASETLLQAISVAHRRLNHS